MNLNPNLPGLRRGTRAVEGSPTPTAASLRRRVEATGYAADPITGELARSPSDGAAPRITTHEGPTSEGGGGVLGRITGLTDAVGRAAVQMVRGVNQRTTTPP